MCFTLRKEDIGKKPKVATEDITVYKVIDPYTGTGAYYSMADKHGMFMPWVQEYIYYEEDKRLFRKGYRRDKIAGGCFHSCKTKKAAKIAGYPVRNECVVKMIIPKGALYYENDKEYVSNMLYYPVQKIKK